MTRIPDVIAEALIAEVKSRREWDEPPALFSMTMASGRCELGEFPVPEMIWAADRPPVTLTRMARATTAMMSGPVSGLGALLRRATPPGLYGIAFRCEAWQVHSGERGTARAEELHRLSHAKKLHEHPDRTEIRSAYAVDRAGITYAAVQERSSDEIKRTVSYPRAGDRGFSGAIPEALDELVRALLSVSLPERESCDAFWKRRDERR